jgi:hypothetical protein
MQNVIQTGSQSAPIVTPDWDEKRQEIQPINLDWPWGHCSARFHRLTALWDRTGRDWTRNESVAGLWAYAQTYGQEVSRLSGTPVAEVALAIGRAVSGVYNKVMNFRAIDPRDARAGMSGAGDTDRRVWSEFYNTETGALRRTELNLEFARLWQSATDAGAPPSEAADEDAVHLARANRLAERGLAALMEKYNREIETRSARPGTSLAAVRTYDRSLIVVAIAKHDFITIGRCVDAYLLETKLRQKPD